MKIEILYPEVGNLFGDSQNVQYLRLSLPEAEFIETDLTARPAFADTDVDMIYQVVYNLFDNAVKFTNEGGSIEVTVTERDAFTEISIKNSGEGIKSEELSKIFDRFYKVDKSRSLDAKGAGLGLYIVKMMVEMHGGKITAHSDSVSQAEFVFTLPKAK